MAEYRYKPGRMYDTTISHCNVLRVAAGTNGYQGGDTGHGGWTRIEIEDEGGTDISVIWDEQAKSLSIELGGDSELHTFKEALRYCLKVLDGQSKWVQLPPDTEINPFDKPNGMARRS